jgi:hypothetical protein
MMNSYRKARLLVLDLIASLHSATTCLPLDSEMDHSIMEEVRELTKDIAASIPYHLANNLQEFLYQALILDGTSKAITPG